jgi:hypothetical protein
MRNNRVGFRWRWDEFCWQLNNKKMKRGIYILFLIVGTVDAFALQPLSDSLSLLRPPKRATASVAFRVHSAGLFMYMGRVVNHNPAADIFFTYTSPTKWGVSVFKVADLADIHSNNNFAFALVSKTFQVGSRITVAPNIGIGLEQQHRFADHGSDVLFMLTSTFRLNKNLTLDHTALFNNLIFETAFSDWTNRVRLLYSIGHLDAITTVWHNNRLIDDAQYLSTGASIFYNRIRLSEKLWLGGGATAMCIASSSNPERFPFKTGIQFSTSLTIR